jgi:6-phosphogluconolactonase
MQKLGTALVLALATQGMGCGSSDSPSKVAASRFALVANQMSDNVSVYTIDPTTGALAPVAGSPFAAGRRPHCVAVTPSGAFAYVANVGTGTQPGGISIFAINPTSGALTLVGGSLMAAGERPRFVAVHPSGSFVYVANSGNLDSSSQKGDLRAFAINRTTGALTPVSGSPFTAGLGPSSVAIHPSGTFAYVPNQYSGDVSIYSINSTTGALSQIAASAVPSGSDPTSAAVHPSGAYAYVVNNTGDSISMFSIDNATGALSHLAGSPLPTGGFPSSVAIHPSGAFALVSNWWDNSMQVYSIDRATGALAAAPNSPFVAGYRPNWVAISSTGAFAYVANSSRLGSGSVSAYTINGATGSLTPVPGSPFAAELEPYSIALAP